MNLAKSFIALALAALGVMHCGGEVERAKPSEVATSTAAISGLEPNEIVIVGTRSNGMPREFQKSAELWSAEYEYECDPQYGADYYMIEGYWWDAGADDYHLVDVYFTEKPAGAGTFSISNVVDATHAAVYVYQARVDTSSDWQEWYSTSTTPGQVQVVLGADAKYHVILDGAGPLTNGTSGILVSVDLTLKDDLDYACGYEYAMPRGYVSRPSGALPITK